MEKIYSEEQHACEIWEVNKEKVDFLIAFSQSLRITRYQKFLFETNLN